jgi:hypothetical protein
MREGRGKNHQAYLWSTVDREKQWCLTFVWAEDEMDGNSFWESSRVVHACCWSHAERHFSEAVQLNPQDPVASAILARIYELFAIDAEARSQRLSLNARDALRQQKSRQLLDEIRKQIEAALSAALPGGRAGQGLQLHADPLGQAHELSGISRTGVE